MFVVSLRLLLILYCDKPIGHIPSTAFGSLRTGKTQKKTQKGKEKESIRANETSCNAILGNQALHDLWFFLWLQHSRAYTSRLGCPGLPRSVRRFFLICLPSIYIWALLCTKRFPVMEGKHVRFKVCGLLDVKFGAKLSEADALQSNVVMLLLW